MKIEEAIQSFSSYVIYVHGTCGCGPQASVWKLTGMRHLPRWRGVVVMVVGTDRLVWA